MSDFILAYLLPWLVSFCLLVVLLVLVFSLPSLYRSILKMPKKVGFLLLIITLSGGLIRFLWVPDDHRIYFDEDRYLSYAVTFARFGKAVSIELATPQRSIMGTPDSAARVTVPVLNAWTLRFFGFEEKNLFRLARWVNTAAILLLFIASYLFFRSYFAALFSAFGLAFLPTPVYFSVSTSFDAYFVFFALLSFVSFCLYARKPTFLNGLLASASLFLLLCVRIESYLFLPILLGAFWIIRRENIPITNGLIKTDLWFVFLAGIFILIRSLASLSILGKPWCCAEALPLEAFSLQYIVRNTLPNLLSLFTKAEFPFVITLLAFLTILGKSSKKVIILDLWLLLFFSVYSLYYAGIFFDYQFSGSYGRYFLMLIPPFLMLSGLALTRLHKSYQIILALCLVTLVPTIINYRKMISSSPYDLLVEKGPRVLHEFLDNKILKETEPDAVIIHNLTAPVLLKGKTAVYAGYLYEKKEVQDFVVEAIKNNKKVYIDQTHRCELFPDVCREIENLFKFTPFIKENFQGLPLELDSVGPK
jgi:hypothetical protein